jgi:hypothetical protein
MSNPEQIRKFIEQEKKRMPGQGKRNKAGTKAWWDKRYKDKAKRRDRNKIAKKSRRANG